MLFLPAITIIRLPFGLIATDRRDNGLSLYFYRPLGLASYLAGKVLIIAFFIGANYDFMVSGMYTWPEVINTTGLLGGAGQAMAASGLPLTR